MDIKKLVSQMTLEEKASMLSGLDFWHTKPIERLGVPSFMVSDGPHGLRKQSETADHLGINDSIEAVCFPAGSAAAASFDRDVLKSIGEAMGDSCQAEKLCVVLGPAVNIKRSPLCGRNFEYYSEDPCLASELAAASIEGVQSRGVGTSIKHFAANNQEHRRMSSSSEIDERTMREIYLAAFEGAVKKGKPWTVMCSYNRINGVYASENPLYLTDILRGEWGFDGYVVSDWGAVSDRVAGVAAGMDLEMPGPSDTNDALVAEAVREGRLDESVVDRAVSRILEIHYRYLENAKPDTVWDKEVQHELAGRIAGECAVLLKNEDALLPFSQDDKIAFIGPFAEKPRFQGGGSSHINCFKTTSALEAAAGRNIVYAKGCVGDADKTDEALLREAEEKAKSAKAAVLFCGLPDSWESEGFDRTHLRMPDCQNELIRRVAAVNPNVVVVLHNGAPVEMPWLQEVKAVLEVYLGGQGVGIGTVNILFGAQNPSGRLPETFPKKLSDTPAYLYYFGEGNRTEYREGVFVGYRYYDKKEMDVLFPFGFGLSYTTFKYSNLRVSAEKFKDTDNVTVSVDVTNTGKVQGAEVVQLYVARESDSVIRPVRELRDFAKLKLEPGETKTTEFKLGKRAFAYWHTGIHDWYAESGEYTIQIGRSSRDIELEHKVCVESSTDLPRPKYTMDSIFMDIMADEKAITAVRPAMEAIQKSMTPEGEQSDVAVSAVSEEMSQAMLKYMPLRGLLSFGNGAVKREQLQQMIDTMNSI